MEHVARTTLSRAAAGDSTAFAGLVAEHHAPMARVVFVICGDPELDLPPLRPFWRAAGNPPGAFPAE